MIAEIKILNKQSTSKDEEFMVNYALEGQVNGT